MSWGWVPYLPTFAVPAVSLWRVFKQTDPRSYEEYRLMGESPYSQRIKSLVSKVIEGNNGRDRTYQARVKDKKQFLEQRIRVVRSKDASCFFRSVGTINDRGGSLGTLFFVINSDGLPETSKNALEWLSARALYPFLDDAAVRRGGFQAIASLFSAFLATAGCGWGPFSSLLFSWAVNQTVGRILDYDCEKESDAFANRHCSNQEKEKAVLFLVESKKQANYFLVSRIESRIKRVKLSCVK